MKFIVTKIILIFFIYLCSPILSSAQEISAILNALQERNTKVEELRELNFNQWKGLYADWQKISVATTPGEGDWLAEIIGFQEPSYKRYWDAMAMDTEAERQLVFSQMEGKYKPMDLEYTLITGGADNVAGYTSGSAYEGDDPEYFFVQDYDIPAHHIYLQFEETLIKAGAPEKPKAEDIEQDPLAVNKWAYKLLVWVGTHLKGLEYTKKEIKWSALAQSQVSESNINSLDSVELQTTLIEASLHFDRLKTHFFNVKKRTDNQNVPEKYASIENYTELSSPSFGAIKIADLKFFSYAVSQLHTLRHPIIVNSQKGARGKVSYSYDYEYYLLPKGEDEISSLEFAETGSGSDSMLVEPLYTSADKLIGGQFVDPRVKTHFVLSSYASLGILSELEIIATGTSFPVWRVEAVSSGEVSIYTSIDCETQTCPYKPFEMYVGWKKLDYTSSEQADYRNGRFSSGDLGENSGYRYGWFTSKTLALWTPAFDNTGLDQWENQVVSSPGSAGEWGVPTSGNYKFILDLGRGTDLRSSGSLVIPTQSVDFALSNAIKFIGSRDDFTFVYDYSVRGYPVPLQTIDDTPNTVPDETFYKAWNTPRLTKIIGRDLIVDLTYPAHLHTKIKLTRVNSGGASSSITNTIDIYNEASKTDVTVIKSNGLGSWGVKESGNLKKECIIEYLDKATASWKATWKANGKMNTLREESQHDGLKFIHTKTDFNGEVTTVKDTDEPSSLTDPTYSGTPWYDTRRLSSKTEVTDGAVTNLTYHKHELPKSSEFYDENLYFHTLASQITTTEGQKQSSEYDKIGRTEKINPAGQKETNYSYTNNTSIVKSKAFGRVVSTNTTVRNDMFTYTTTSAPIGATPEKIVTKLHDTGLKWETKSIRNNTTGVLKTFEHKILPKGALRTTIKTGIGATNVTKGTKVITETNKDGYVISTKSYDIASDLLLSETTGTMPTAWGQPTVYTDRYGQKTTTTYDPDTQLAISSIDVLGVSTSYERDDSALRVTKATRNGVNIENDYTVANQVSKKITGSDITTSKSTVKYNKIRRTEVTNTGLVESNLKIQDINGSSTYKNTTFGITGKEAKDVDGITSNKASNTQLAAQAKNSVVGVENGIESTSKNGPGSVKITTDGKGMTKKMVIPSADGSTQTVDNVIDYLDNGATRVTTDSDSGIQHMEESFPYHSTGAVTRSGLDMNGNKQLDAGDRYSETTTSISNGKIITTAKATRSSGFETIYVSTYDPATGVTTLADSDAGTLTTTTPERVNGILKSVETTSTSGDVTKKSFIDNNGQVSSTTYSSPSSPDTTKSTTRRSDGSVISRSTTIAGIGSYGMAVDEKGLLTGISHPLKTFSDVSQSFASDGKMTLTVNDGSGSRSLVAAPDGSSVEISGANVENSESTLAIEGETYKAVIKPEGGAHTVITENAAGASTKKAYLADYTAKTRSYYKFGGIKDRTNARGAKTSFTYTNDIAKDLEKIEHESVSSNGVNVYTPTVTITRNPYGAAEMIQDGSGKRQYTYSKGNTKDITYLTGALAGYKIIRTFDSQNRQNGVKLEKGNTEITANTFNYLGSSFSLTSVSGNNTTATYQRDPVSKLVTSMNRAVTTGTLSDTYTFTNGGRLTGVDSSHPSVADFSYSEFYPSGKRKKNTTSEGTWSYEYDSYGHLNKATHSAHGTFLYNIDQLGRRSYPSTSGDDFNDLNQPTLLPRDSSYTIDIRAHQTAQLWVNGVSVTNPGVPFTYTVQPAPTPEGSWQLYEVRGVIPQGGDELDGENLDAVAKYRGFAYSPPPEEQFGYDSDGNRTSSALWNYHWDANDRMVEATTKDFITNPDIPGYQIYFYYDAEGRRYKKTVTSRLPRSSGRLITEEKTCWYLYDGWSLLYERHEKGINNAIGLADATLERRYTWGLDLNGSATIGAAGGAGGLVSYTETTNGSSETYYPTYDGGGHVTALVRKSDNNVVAKYAYGPFGELIEATGTKAESNPWRYATKYYDVETELYYFGYRYYDEVTGSFLSREPLGEGEALNLYSYCHHDPINGVDRLGLDNIYVIERLYFDEFGEEKINLIVVYEDTNGASDSTHHDIGKIIQHGALAGFVTLGGVTNNDDLVTSMQSLKLKADEYFMDFEDFSDEEWLGKALDVNSLNKGDGNNNNMLSKSFRAAQIEHHMNADSYERQAITEFNKRHDSVKEGFRILDDFEDEVLMAVVTGPMGVSSIAVRQAMYGSKYVPSKRTLELVNDAKEQRKFSKQVENAPKSAPAWCFIAGTKVKTKGGSKPIEEVEVGDEVLTRDESTGELSYKKVVETFHNFTDQVYKIQIGADLISTTGNHRFWLPKENKWVEARDLKVGHYLLNSELETVSIDEISTNKGIVDVYNLEVDTNHNYFAGDSEVLVHNGDLEFDDFNQARNQALEWLEKRGFKAEKQNFGRLGDTKGKPIGMQTADGKIGFRVEFDKRRGAHINVWNGKEKGPHIKFKGTAKSVNNIHKHFLCK